MQTAASLPADDASPANRAARRARSALERGGGLMLLLTLLGLWEVSARYWTDSANWPPLSTVVIALGRGLMAGELAQAYGSSLLRMLIGYLIGGVVGVLLGMAMARSRLAHAALEPSVELLRPIPVPAIVPPLILLLGIDDALKIFLVAFATLFPVLINTLQGVRAVDPTLLAVARTFRVGRRRTLQQIVLPASLPYVFAGLRVSLALALIVTIVAEMIAGSAGIGYYLVSMQYAMRAADMYAGVLLIALTGYLLNAVFIAVERRVLPWYSGDAN
ncbi:MAG: ABC transporter permease [Burkholderiaceae bacterium]